MRWLPQELFVQTDPFACCVVSGKHPGTVQAFWPEANVLIGRILDTESNEPDYNAIVTITKTDTPP